MNTITINQIENTKAFQSLNPIQQSFAIKRKNRELLTNALIVHKSTGVIPGNVFGYNLAILEEMILGESVIFENPPIIEFIGCKIDENGKSSWIKNNESAN